MKRLTIYLFLLFLYQNCLSQVEFHDVYTPMQVDTKSLTGNLAKTKKSLDTFVAQQKDQPKPVKKSLKEVNEARYFGINSLYENRHFYSDQALISYFENILEEIYRANPWINADEINFLIARYPWPNAFSLGEGTIVLNIGLVNIYENDAQMAFALCHELAHQLQNHINNDLLQRMIKYHSPEFQAELKKIAKSEYRQNTMLRELAKDFVIDNRKHSRLDETEADSVALMLLRNTVFPEEEALVALAKLDSVDGEDVRNTLKIEEIFNFENYPFKEKWLEKEDVLVKFNQDSFYWEVDDSLKTHPDIPDRIKFLEKFIQPKENSRVNLRSEDSYYEQTLIADFEKIECYYQADYYDLAIYHALLLREKYPNNTYLNGMIGLMFYELYMAQKKHEFSRYVQKPNPNFSPKFLQVLNFLNSMRLTELSSIGYHFMKQYQNADYLTEHYLFAFHQLSKTLSKKEDAEQAKESYLKNFPLGKYVDKF